MYLFFDIFIIFPLHVHKLASTSCNSFVCVCLYGGGGGGGGGGVGVKLSVNSMFQDFLY